MATFEITAHQRRFGVTQDDEQFPFLWTRDDKRDFVFSLTRFGDGNVESPIEYMLLDQVWESIADFDCRIDDSCIRAQVPITLRQYTQNCDEIVVFHGCTGEALRELIEVLSLIFKGKTGMSVHAR